MSTQVRETSIEAYNQIKAEGLLSERRFQVYQILFKYGPISSGQMVEIAKKHKKLCHTGSFQGRLSELRDIGVVAEVKKGPCPITGRNVIFWDVTKRLPIKLKRPETKDQIIARLERENAELREKITKIMGVDVGDTLSLFDND